MTSPLPIPLARTALVRDRLTSLLLTVLVLAVSLVITFGAWRSAKEDADINAKVEFDFKVREITDRTRQRLAAHEQILRSAHAFFTGSEKVRREEFRNFVSSLMLEKTYPGIKGVGVSFLVARDRKYEYMTEIRQQGFPGYDIFPTGDRGLYAPVVLLEPFDENARFAFGFDQYSDADRRHAMEMARDYNIMTVTRQVALKNDVNSRYPGFLMFLPLYRKGALAATIEERRANIIGWIYVPVRMGELMDGVVGERASDISVEISYGEYEGPGALIYDSDATPSATLLNKPRLQSMQNIDFGGQNWLLAAYSNASFEDRLDSGKPKLIAWTGVLLSLLLALLTYLLSSGRMRALALAQKMNEGLSQNEAHFRFVTEAAQALIWMCDRDKNCIWFNKVWLDFTGRTLEEDQGCGWSSGVHPDDLPQSLETFDIHFGRQEPFTMEYRLRRHDGEYRWIQDNGKPFYDAAGYFDGYIGSCFDITEHKRAEEELQLASTVYKTSGEAIAVTDADGHFLAVNPAFTQLTGYTQEEAIGKTPRIFKSGHHSVDFYQAMWHSIVTTGHWQGEIWNRRKNGEIFPEWLSISSTFNDDGSVQRRVAMFSDITKKKRLEELLWQQANIDLLTGLPNRRMLLDRLDQEINRSNRSGEPLALLFLDLDEFKDVNDTLGHDIGDMLLKMAAERLTACVRSTDTVARLGGDEFTVLLSNLRGPKDIDRVAGTILQKLSEPFHLESELIYISASIGITIYPDDSDLAEELLKNADQAMYAAKGEGKNRYQFFTKSMQEAAQARARMVSDLRGAIAGGQLRVWYQPIVELASDTIYKAEALVRWQHPTRGLVSPAEFIPLAEDTGLIVEIGDWVFREVASEVSRIRKLHSPNFQISVNKSPVQFRKDQILYQTWFDYLQRLDLSGNGIAIEITESLLMDIGSAVTERLNAFRAAGMQISLDDFGTGYSSLSYLKKLDLDYLKIDQSFVRNLTADSEDLALCEAIIVMAHKLDIKVIAEGVETVEQRDLLAAAGCDYAQGYFFSRPLPADEFHRLLQSHADSLLPT